jgi:hypothetical protein
MDRTRYVPFRSFAIMSVFACLLSLLASAPARARCTAARTVGSTAPLSEAWRTSLDELIRSTAEPGHPWSCEGGTIDLQLDADGGLLSVAREGEEPATRRVASPEDVLPLGQALLATPLPADASEPQSPTEQGEPKAALPEPPPGSPAAAPAPAAATPANNHSRRLLLSAGIDGRGVGGSNVGWIGPTLSAGIVLGQWLPSISFRYQSAFMSDGPPLDELSVAVAVQSLFELSPFELRTGLALRGAVVQRDLPRPQGEQSRLEGRIGAVIGFAIPVFSWANLVLSVDADVVAISREIAQPDATSDGETPTSFPKYTVGGSACLEIPL